MPNPAWKKGVSANPSGKRKDGKPRRDGYLIEVTQPDGIIRMLDTRELKHLAQKEGTMCIATLAAIRDAPRAASAARISAIQVLLEYGYGKPTQTINHRIIRSVGDLSDEELNALLASEEEAEAPLQIEGKAE